MGRVRVQGRTSGAQDMMKTMWRPAVDRSGASAEPGSPAGGRRSGALHPVALCCTGTRMCCTEIGSKAACACSAHTCLRQHAVDVKHHLPKMQTAACCHACTVPREQPQAIILHSSGVLLDKIRYGFMHGGNRTFSADLLMGGLSAQHCEDGVALAHSRLQGNGPFPRKVRVDLAWQREGNPHSFATAWSTYL